MGYNAFCLILAGTNFRFQLLLAFLFNVVQSHVGGISGVVWAVGACFVSFNIMKKCVTGLENQSENRNQVISIRLVQAKVVSQRYNNKLSWFVLEY